MRCQQGSVQLGDNPKCNKAKRWKIWWNGLRPWNVMLCALSCPGLERLSRLATHQPAFAALDVQLNSSPFIVPSMNCPMRLLGFGGLEELYQT